MLLLWLPPLLPPPHLLLLLLLQGFLVNRVLIPMINEAFFCLMEVRHSVTLLLITCYLHIRHHITRA
jgi:hypothetical protein